MPAYTFRVQPTEPLFPLCVLSTQLVFPAVCSADTTINYPHRIFGQHPHSLRCVLCKQNDRSRCVFRWLARPQRRADPTHRTAQQSCSKKNEEQALRTEARSGAAQATRADVEGETTHQNVSTTRRCTRRLSSAPQRDGKHLNPKYNDDSW